MVNRRSGPFLVSIVVLLIGGFVAIYLGKSFKRAGGSASQKRSMADLRTLGSVAEAYACDQGTLPDARTLNDFLALVEPKYVKQPPREDMWGTAYRYVSWREFDSSPPGSDRYAVISAGSDRKFEHEDGTLYALGPIDDFARDLVYSNGEFLRFPTAALSRRVMTPEDLWARLQKDEVIVIDAQHEDEYQLAHLPKALHIPDHDLRARAGEIPRKKPIVVYEASACGESRESPEFELEMAGIRDVYVLFGGIDRWRKLNFPIESGSR